MLGGAINMLVQNRLFEFDFQPHLNNGHIVGSREVVLYVGLRIGAHTHTFTFTHTSTHTNTLLQ